MSLLLVTMDVGAWLDDRRAGRAPRTHAERILHNPTFGRRLNGRGWSAMLMVGVVLGSIALGGTTWTWTLGFFAAAVVGMWAYERLTRTSPGWSVWRREAAPDSRPGLRE